MRRFLYLFLFVPVAAFAQEMPAKFLAAEESSEMGRFFEEFLNMALTLGMIVGVMLIIAWVVKKFLNTQIDKMNETSQIKILERRSLAPKSTIYILEIEGKKVIVGETPAGLSHLGDLPQ